MRFSKIKLARCRKCKWYKKSKWGKMEVHFCGKLSKSQIEYGIKKSFRTIPLICFYRERINANERNNSENN